MTTSDTAERLGAAATLLSLDRVLPFHASMGVRPSAEGERLRDLVRWAIERNREAFVANPGSPPDLRHPLMTALKQSFGDTGVSDFFSWYTGDFVHGADDFKYYGNWYQFFSRLNGMPSRWEQVALPQKVRDKAKESFAHAKDISELQAMEDVLEAAPLSRWDAQIFTLHRLYAEGREPFAWVLETVRKRRFMTYLRWLAQQLDEPAKHAFVESAMALKDRISTFDGTPAFPVLFDDIG